MNLLLLRNCLILIVALLHFYFLILEMFLWTKPRGLKTFRMTPEQAQSTKVLAANQGLYNGFLALGLIWSMLTSNLVISTQLAIFFLGCVIAASLFGGHTVGKKILIIQGAPAFLALIAVFLSWHPPT